MTTLNWQAKLAEVEAQIAISNPTDRAIGQGIAKELRNWGSSYQYWWVTNPARTRGETVLVESAEHIRWSSDYAAQVTELTEIAERAEAENAANGGPPPQPSAGVRVRLANCLSLQISAGTRRLIQIALESVPVLGEPRYFTAAYYARGGRSVSYPTFGTIEQSLTDAMDAADEWLAISGDP